MTRGRIAIVAGTPLALGACSEPRSTAPPQRLLSRTRPRRRPLLPQVQSAHLGGAATLSLRFFNPSPAILRTSCWLHIDIPVSVAASGACTMAIAEQIVDLHGTHYRYRLEHDYLHGGKRGSALRFLDRHECQRRAPGDVQRA